ncbi:MAG TPA: glycine dehydrogenase (aminomethyl-transferring), partial [Ginsengibacter sp.]
MNLFEKQSSEFAARHIGPNKAETQEMLSEIGVNSIEELIDKTVPAGIRLQQELDVPPPLSEFEYINELREIAQKNKVFKSYIGQGYYDTIVPNVILRSLFENPGWYTQYTPYQAEIAQGRLESLLNYQTVVSDLTGLPIANASLLDEGTAAAEAMAMLFNHKNKDHDHITAAKFFIDEKIFTQTKDVLTTRAKPIGIEIVFGNYDSIILNESFFGAIVQYPNNEGSIEDYRRFIEQAHSVNV